MGGGFGGEDEELFGGEGVIARLAVGDGGG